MPDEKPAPAKFVLRQKEIEILNPRSLPGDGTAISVGLIHSLNRNAEELGGPPVGMEGPPPVPPGFKPKDITPMDHPGGVGEDAPIVVSDMLRTNLGAEEKSGWARISLKVRRRVRHHRDFLLVAGTTDLLVGFLVAKAGDPFTFVCGISAMTLVTTLAAWHLYVVGDPY
jgi:hypothetical protein